nr:ABC transporter substrate-binding protein [Nostoc sp. CHAB 5824]
TVPQQATTSLESWHFQSPEGKKVFNDWANSHTAFDLKLANQLLDECGLSKRDGDGFRLRKDGKRLSLMIDIPPQNAVTETDCALLVSDGWKQMGIDVVIKNWPGAEHQLRQKTGKFEVSTHGQAEMDLFTYPDWVFPTADNYWHAQVGKWYKSAGKEGEAPTGEMKYLLELYAKLSKEKDIEKAHKVIHEAIRFHTKQGLFMLGTSANPPSLVIVKDGFRNVPEDPRVLGPWAVSGPATSYTETFFFAPDGWKPSPSAAVSPPHPPSLGGTPKLNHIASHNQKRSYSQPSGSPQTWGVRGADR